MFDHITPSDEYVKKFKESMKKEYGEDIKETKINSELTLELLNYNRNDSIGEFRN